MLDLQIAILMVYVYRKKLQTSEKEHLDCFTVLMACICLSTTLDGYLITRIFQSEWKMSSEVDK